MSSSATAPILVALMFLIQLPLQLYAAPGSLYQVLGVGRDASVDDIKSAYDGLRGSWLSDKSGKREAVVKIIEIQHAYDVLSNDLRRRDYNFFQVDELKETVAEVKKQYAGSTPATLPSPLWELAAVGEPLESMTVTLTSDNFGKIVFESTETWLIQVYSQASLHSWEFTPSWERVAKLLEGVATLGKVELGTLPLSMLLAERNLATGHPIFRHGLPELILVTPDCKQLDCLIRYRGEKSVASLGDWVATHILKLPRIMYYSAETLITDVIQRTGPHKVKVIAFSSTGERAAPHMRQAAKQYWQHAVFAMVLWRESNATFWETRLGVESAPALVFLKDPGVKPVIYHELPQLRSITAVELGCDAAGYSRAGNDTNTWYCVIVAGKPGLQLNQMRGVMRGVLQKLRSEELAEEVQTPSLAAAALSTKRLSLTWLDGETQKDVCYFYLHSENVFDTCGPRRYGDTDDIPKIFLVRYQRLLITAEEEELRQKKKKQHARTLWDALQAEDHNVASQLVSKYNGSIDISEIIAWISDMVHEGDKLDLPNFKGKMAALVVEENVPLWVRTGSFASNKRDKLVEKGERFLVALYDYSRDPKMLPVLAFIVVFFGSQCLLRKRNLGTLNQLEEAGSTQPEVTGETRQSTSPSDETALKNSNDELGPSVSSNQFRRRKESQP